VIKLDQGLQDKDGKIRIEIRDSKIASLITMATQIYDAYL